MPGETKQAIEWALQQEGITKENCHQLVDKVREYFNMNNISYNSFCYDDLTPFFN